MYATDDTKKTRLGDILIDKGLINESQLDEAIGIQRGTELPLGQILVDQGWVSRRQIDQALKVQSKLRNALVSSIISLSPLAMVGCGAAEPTDEDKVVETQQIEEIENQTETESENSDDTTIVVDDSDASDEGSGSSNGGWVIVGSGQDESENPSQDTSDSSPGSPSNDSSANAPDTEDTVEEPVVVTPELDEQQDSAAEPEAPQVIAPVEVVAQPSNQSLNVGDNAILSVEVQGGGEISYQWYKDGVPLSNGATNTLSLSNTLVSDSGIYHVSVSNSVSSVSSLKVLVEVADNDTIEPIVIVAQPENASLEEGQSVTLSVNATGGGDLKYQWYKDGRGLQGETSSSLALSNVALDDAALYRVTVSNALETAVSDSVRVDVSEQVEELAPILITSQPSAVSVDEGDSVELSVVANGGGDLTYQWYKNGVALNGETDANLSLNEVSENDGASYRVEVSNSEETVASHIAVVEVSALAEELAPIVITAQPTGVIIDEGQTVNLSVSATGGGELAYQWYKDGSALTGQVSANLSLADVLTSDSASYTVEISNTEETIVSQAALVEVQAVAELDPILITTQPSGITLDEGGTVDLSVVASGGGDLTYQWYKDGVAIVGQTSANLSLANVLTADSASYTVEISNAEETLLSSAAVVEVTEVAVLRSVEFNWNYPTERTDGSDFEVFEVESFRIYQVTDSEVGDQVHEVDGADTTFTVDDLPEGDYHFSITVVDTDGNESELSDAVSITI